MSLLIIADENIPYVEEAFSEIGTIQCFSGREINSKMVKYADILLVRSVTKVNADLLKNSSIKIVCSATIGTDHVDLDFLNKNGVAFSYAAGSNANSVAEYIIASILELATKYTFNLSELTLGIVGIGNIGKIVKKMATALGIKVLLNDPPLARKTDNSMYQDLDELLEADIITLHVPLTKTGRDKTFHLFDRSRIKKMKEGSILINTSRGPVVDNHALKMAIKSQQIQTSILDVWENEPNIDPELLSLVELGTPHIAGYSLDGKANGTYQVYRAVCNYFDITPVWNPKDSLPLIKQHTIQTENRSNHLEVNLASVIRNVYDIRKDDADLKALIEKPDLDPSSYFDQLRKEYPVRREFSNYQIFCTNSQTHFYDQLRALGFKVHVGISK